MSFSEPSAGAKPVLFDLAALPVPMVYAEHRIIRDCNAEFARQFGYEPAELINRSFNVLYPRLADFVLIGTQWSHNFAGGRTYADERIMRRRDGSQFWCRVRGHSMLAEDPFSEAVYCFEAMARPVRQYKAGLTDRQHQIVTLVAQGKTNADIAEETQLSARTVETHRLRLIRSLGLKNSAELVAWFFQNAAVPPEQVSLDASRETG